MSEPHHPHTVASYYLVNAWAPQYTRSHGISFIHFTTAAPRRKFIATEPSWGKPLPSSAFAMKLNYDDDLTCSGVRIGIMSGSGKELAKLIPWETVSIHPTWHLLRSFYSKCGLYNGRREQRLRWMKLSCIKLNSNQLSSIELSCIAHLGLNRFKAKKIKSLESIQCARSR